MKRKKVTAVILGISILITACASKPEEDAQLNDIVTSQAYVDILLGEAYHQEQVKFDIENDRAVIPQSVKWGRHGFREKSEAGIFYGEAEGGEIYETDMETTPELYIESYLDSVKQLNLNAKEIENADYVIQIVKKSELEPFEEELAMLTTLIMKDNYMLTGVEIKFDKQCRPIEKSYQLQSLDEDELKKENIDNKEFLQKFSYDSGKNRFEKELKKVKREIE